MASIRLTESQEKFIKEFGLTKSEFVRRSVDYYILYLKNGSQDFVISELEKWIETMKCNTCVLHDNTDVLNNNTNNTDVLQNNTVVLQNNRKKDIKTILQKELQTLQRLINNPENMDSIPDYTLKMLSKKYDLSKSSIQAWITENKEYIKTGDFEKR